LKLFGVESETEVLKDDRYTLTLRVAAKAPSTSLTRTFATCA